jgi:hypothetical protein
MGDDIFYLTDSLIHRVINVIYSILLIGFVWITYGSRFLKFLVVVAFFVSAAYTASFIYTLIQQAPQQELRKELIYHDSY